MSLMKDRDSFQEWKDHPGTRDFLAYLAERQSRLMEAWGQGANLSPEEQAAAVLLGNLSKVSFEDMVWFYQLETGDASQEVKQ